MFQPNCALVAVVEGEAIRYDLGEPMKSTLKNQTFLRISAARVAVVGAVATGAAFGLAACGDSDDVDPAPDETTTVTSTEELDDDRDDRDDDDRDDDDRGDDRDVHDDDDDDDEWDDNRDNRDDGDRDDGHDDCVNN